MLNLFNVFSHAVLRAFLLWVLIALLTPVLGDLSTQLSAQSRKGRSKVEARYKGTSKAQKGRGYRKSRGGRKAVQAKKKRGTYKRPVSSRAKNTKLRAARARRQAQKRGPITTKNINDGDLVSIEVKEVRLAIPDFYEDRALPIAPQVFDGFEGRILEAFAGERGGSKNGAGRFRARNIKKLRVSGRNKRKRRPSSKIRSKTRPKRGAVRGRKSSKRRGNKRKARRK